MTQRLPDTSTWFTPERAMDEHIQWLLHGWWKKQLAFLMPRLTRYEIKSVVEFGCGTGLLASGLPTAIQYTGIDANQWMVRKAIERNAKLADRCFIQGDARDALVFGKDAVSWDLAMAFAFLKNFHLDEWHMLLGKVLSAGRQGAFDVQVRDEALDDGTEFHHIFVTEAMLAEAIAGAGHREVEREVTAEWEHMGARCKNVAVWTERVSGEVFPRVDLSRGAIPLEEAIALEKVVEDAGRNFKPNPILEIDGKPVEDVRRCSLRWAGEAGEVRPVLYLDGKRVVKPWSIRLAHDEPADPFGGNANTAE